MITGLSSRVRNGPHMALASGAAARKSKVQTVPRTAYLPQPVLVLVARPCRPYPQTYRLPF